MEDQRFEQSENQAVGLSDDRKNETPDIQAAGDSEGMGMCPPVQEDVDGSMNGDGGTHEEATAPEQRECRMRGWWTGAKRGAGAIWKRVWPVVKRRWGLITVAALLVVLIVVGLKVYNSLAAKRDYYESLSQTIMEMKKISEFCTANYVGEVMVMDEERSFLKRKNIVLIVKGKVRAGFDLTKMHTEVVGDTAINVTIPPPKVLDIITNPSDIRTFSEKGTWSHERTTMTKNAARAKLMELVMEEHLLDVAEENGRRQLEALFSAFGFRHVNIKLANSAEGDDFETVVGDSVSGKASTLVSD